MPNGIEIAFHSFLFDLSACLIFQLWQPNWWQREFPLNIFWKIEHTARYDFVFTCRYLHSNKIPLTWFYSTFVCFLSLLTFRVFFKSTATNFVFVHATYHKIFIVHKDSFIQQIKIKQQIYKLALRHWLLC